MTISIKYLCLQFVGLAEECYVDERIQIDSDHNEMTVISKNVIYKIYI